MRWQYTPYGFPLVVAAAVAAALAVYAWRRRPAHGATPLAVLMAAVAQWALAYTLELASETLAGQLFWDDVSYFGVVIAPAAWLAFALEYTGRERWLTPRNLALLSLEPLLILVLVWTNGTNGLIRSEVHLGGLSGFAIIVEMHGAGFWLNVAYSYVLLLLGTILIFPLFQGLARPSFLYRGQAGMLLLAVAAPWGDNAIYVAGLSPFPGLDLTPFAFTLSGGALAWSLLRFRLLDILPVARDAVIESMSDAVIVLDHRDRVVDINPAARAILGPKGIGAIGQAFAEVFASWPDLVRRRDETDGLAQTMLLEGAARWWLDVRISPLCDRSGQLTGRLVVLDDITEHMQTEEALRESEERFRKSSRTRRLVWLCSI